MLELQLFQTSPKSDRKAEAKPFEPVENKDLNKRDSNSFDREYKAQPDDRARSQSRADGKIANDSSRQSSKSVSSNEEPDGVEDAGALEADSTMESDVGEDDLTTPDVSVEDLEIDAAPISEAKTPEIAETESDGEAEVAEASAPSEADIALQEEPEFAAIDPEQKPSETAAQTRTAEPVKTSNRPIEAMVKAQALQQFGQNQSAVETSAKLDVAAGEEGAAEAVKATALPKGVEAQAIAQANSPNSADPRETRRSERQTTDQKASITAPDSTTPRQTAAPQPMVSAAQQSANALQVAAKAETADFSTLIASDAEVALPWDSRSPTSTQMQQVLNRPETPVMISRQLAEAIQRMPDRPVELTLNPEELGRVRMSIAGGENGITVNVLAERPETLDLMRRHIDQLARDFQAIGYDNINFAFGEGQAEHAADGEGSDGNQGQSSGNTIEAAGHPDTPDAPIRLAETTGLDLRL